MAPPPRRQSSPPTDTTPSWAPDGGKIVYAAYSEQIYTANPDGSGTVPLAGGDHGHEPTWSPDGTQIAFGKLAYVSTFLDLNIVNVGGGLPVVVPVPYPAEYTQWIDAAWSPDGTRLSYRSTFDNGYGYERVVGRFGGASLGLPKVQGVNMGGGRAASWSPNGQRLTFDGGTGSAREVYVGNADGSGSVTSIATGGKNSEPSWRPDPQVTPYVPVVVKSAPAGGPGQAPPSGQRPPKRVWFTNKIPITASAPVHVMIVGCGAPDCGASVRGKVPSASIPAGLNFRPATSSKKVAKQTVVGSGGLKLREGEEKPLLLYLNKAGRALLKLKGKLDFEATVTVTGTGQAPVTSQKTIHVVLAKPKKKH